jgi:hypothetical protein
MGDKGFFSASARGTKDRQLRSPDTFTDADKFINPGVLRTVSGIKVGGDSGSLWLLLAQESPNNDLLECR